MFLTTADRLGATEFLGYEEMNAEGLITAMIKDDVEIDHASAGDEVSIIFNQTPFYAESGGQMGDLGQLCKPGTTDTIGQVTDTWKTPNGMFVHKTILKADIKSGDSVQMNVDVARRELLKSNHSATHLMHEALREVLGDHVMQKGSLVAPERLRFDFSHTKQVSAEELSQVESIVNERIRMNSDVSTRLMTPDDAIAEGALALFGEKYGDEVRVVSMGGPTDVEGRSAWSVELCGGTHVNRTGDISLFKVTSEGAVAGGVRRIEAVTNQGAIDWVNQRLDVLAQAASAVKSTPEQLAERVTALVAERRKADQMITDLRKQLAEGGGGGSGNATEINGVIYERRILENTPAKDLKSIADGILKSMDEGVVAIISTDEGKASIVVGVTQGATDRFNAVDLVRVGSAALGGKGGGGRPDMAQAGGPDGDKAEAALDAIAESMAN